MQDQYIHYIFSYILGLKEENDFKNTYMERRKGKDKKHVDVIVSGKSGRVICLQCIRITKDNKRGPEVID